MGYIWAAFSAIFVWHVVSELLHRRSIERLLDRLMAKDYKEFQYFEREHPIAVKELKKELASTLEVQSQKIQEPIDDDVDRFLKNVEEDWLPTDIDSDAVKKAIRNEALAGQKEG